MSPVNVRRTVSAAFLFAAVLAGGAVASAGHAGPGAVRPAVVHADSTTPPSSPNNNTAPSSNTIWG